MVTLIYNFFKDESGSESAEMAILLPIILLVVMFITDRFIQYEGLTTTTVASNEALRAAIVQTNSTDAQEVAKSTLVDRFNQSGVGWCSGESNSGCATWNVTSGTTTTNQSTFKNNKNKNFLFSVQGDWCNGGSGHSVTLGVRTHKSSLFPSYENFRSLMSGGPIYHTHTYIIKALIESDTRC